MLIIEGMMWLLMWIIMMTWYNVLTAGYDFMFGYGDEMWYDD